jgi:hypothetical protein
VQCVFIAGELRRGVQIRVGPANRDLTKNWTKLDNFISTFNLLKKARKSRTEIVGYVRGLWRLVLSSKPQIHEAAARGKHDRRKLVSQMIQHLPIYIRCSS